MSTKDNPESSRVWRFFEVSSYLMPPANVLILAGLTVTLITGDFGGRKAAMDHIEETPTIKLGDHIDTVPFFSNSSPGIVDIRRISPHCRCR